MDDAGTGQRLILGPAVRCIREAKGLKLDVLATRAGIHFGYLSRVERGQRNPTVEKIAAIAAALEVPVDGISYVLPAKDAA
jgi:transcriptional regulator with XRE-family HTH domain